MPRDWLILRGGDRLRWGGDLRRRFLFESLETRTGATVVRDFGRQDVRAAFAPYRRRRWEVWRRGPAVASSELLDPLLLELATRVGVPEVIDIHDEPELQARAFGLDLEPARVAELRARLATNLAAFRVAVAPSETFLRVAGIDPRRAIVAPNGTDTRHIDARPMPEGTVVGFSSGASAGRGIETLVEAARVARRAVPDLELQLWLVAVGDESARYRDGLRERLAGDPWIRIAEAAYDALPAALSHASVHCVPNPPGDYWESVLPIKLFDSMAAGRPVVVTPRVEMRAVVERYEAGIVAGGDAPEDLAAALVELLRDPDRAARLGANARRAAETTFDWRVIGDRLADQLLARRP
jgi:glycosyltransferase involved in cell wall biosynthesis